MPNSNFLTEKKGLLGILKFVVSNKMKTKTHNTSCLLTLNQADSRNPN